MFGLTTLAGLPYVFHCTVDAPIPGEMRWHHQVKSKEFPKNHFAIRGTYPPFISYIKNSAAVTLFYSCKTLDSDGLNESNTLNEWLIIRREEGISKTTGKTIEASDWPQICKEFTEALALEKTASNQPKKA
jgi:hypothetical protein